MRAREGENMGGKRGLDGCLEKAGAEASHSAPAELSNCEERISRSGRITAARSSAEVVVGVAGFEPAASGVQGRNSTN